MPTEMLTKEERRAPSPAPSPRLEAPESEPAVEARDSRRRRRLRLNAAAWVVGTILITTLWVLNQWSANGAFESFGHEGDPGEWNPTLWALVVGGWGLVVGIMALGVYFTGRSVHFHAAAWALGMVVLTPLWALIEWQDNGHFERWSDNGTPGDWDPWILTVAGVWLLTAAALVFRARRRARRS